MLRPTVVLPQPDSPTSASVSPRRTVRSTPSTAFTWPRDALQNAGADREPGLSPRSSRRGSPPAAVMPPPPARPDGTRRACVGDTPCRAGTSLRQRSKASGQRGVEAAPGRPLPRPRHGALDLLQPAPARLRPRDGAQQPLRVGMPRPAQQLLARALLDDLARIHDGDPVGDHVHHAEVVGDEEHRRAGGGGQVADQLQDLGADGGVERGGGLVADEQPRAHGHRHGDHHPLLEAAGELVRIGIDALRRVGDADHAEHLDRRAGAPRRPRPRCGAGSPPAPGRRRS